jgi:hypothetical protein
MRWSEATNLNPAALRQVRTDGGANRVLVTSTQPCQPDASVNLLVWADGPLMRFTSSTGESFLLRLQGQ